MIALLTSTAFAFTCQTYEWFDHPDGDHDPRGLCEPNFDECKHPPGSAVSYKLGFLDFSPSEIDDLVAGISGWNSGPGLALDDATFAFNRTTPDTSTRSFDDDQTTVTIDTFDWFQAVGLGGVEAVTITAIEGYNPFNPGCPWRAADVVFNRQVGNFDWVADVPSNLSEDYSGDHERSFGIVALHNFGHVFGLADNSAAANTMVSRYPHGGECNGLYRAQEDEARALVAVKGNGSAANRNFMVSRFTTRTTDASGVVLEDEWRHGGNVTYAIGLGESVLLSSGSENLFDQTFAARVAASVTGNVTTAGPVDIQWVWRPTDATWPCRNPPSSHVLSTRTVTLGNNSPAEYLPLNGVLNAPTSSLLFRTDKQYQVCVVINPHGNLSETKNNDNAVATEHLYVRE